jgi:hypothetical protein
MCDFLGNPIRWDGSEIFPAPKRLRPAEGTGKQRAIQSIVCQAYDVMRDDGALRSLRDLPPDDAASAFDGLRDHYKLRPEFRHFVVELSDVNQELATILRELGFQTTDSHPDR